MSHLYAGRKPWLETWFSPEGNDSDQPLHEGWRADTIEEARLFAAAPEMCRALLAAEWGGRNRDYGAHCPACGAIAQFTASGEHDSGCSLDAALTKSGIDTQEKRDAARKEMGI